MRSYRVRFSITYYVKADDEDSAIDEALDMVAEDFGLSVRDAILDSFDIKAFERRRKRSR
ncbi:MAG: hypothetical protein QXT14_02920 [Candidatus Bathyarchaeia archaeon]